jgi:hypothetical protein
LPCQPCHSHLAWGGWALLLLWPRERRRHLASACARDWRSGRGRGAATQPQHAPGTGVWTCVVLRSRCSRSAPSDCDGQCRTRAPGRSMGEGRFMFTRWPWCGCRSFCRCLRSGGWDAAAANRCHAWCMVHGPLSHLPAGFGCHSLCCWDIASCGGRDLHRLGVLVISLLFSAPRVSIRPVAAACAWMWLCAVCRGGSGVGWGGGGGEARSKERDCPGEMREARSSTNERSGAGHHGDLHIR